MAMNDQDTPAIGGQVNGLFFDRDVAVGAAKASYEFIVVPGIK